MKLETVFTNPITQEQAKISLNHYPGERPSWIVWTGPNYGHAKAGDFGGESEARRYLRDYCFFPADVDPNDEEYVKALAVAEESREARAVFEKFFGRCKN